MTNPWEDQSDEGFSLNFSDKEAASEAREFSVLPSGTYLVRVDDGEMKESTSEKNYGKPYVSFTFEITEDNTAEGKYVGQKAWSNVMLFAGALYSAAQMMKAVDLDPKSGDKFPPIEWWIGKEMVIVTAQENAKTKDEATGRYVDKTELDENGKTRVLKRSEVKGYRAPSSWKKNTSSAPAGRVTGSKGSMLPT
jgi:hypothetical protein